MFVLRVFTLFQSLQLNYYAYEEVQRRPSLPIKSYSFASKIKGPVQSFYSCKSATYSDFKEVLEETENEGFPSQLSKPRYHEYNNPSVTFELSPYQDSLKEDDVMEDTFTEPKPFKG